MAIQSRTARTKEIILERILTGNIEPGAIINRRDMASDLRMGMAPVTEAILSLEAEGFLETRPRKGTQVRRATPEIVFSHIILRESLECTGARLYRGKPVRKEGPRLLELAGKIDESTQEGRIKELDKLFHYQRWQLEKWLHLTLMDLAGLPVLTEYLNRILNLYLFFEINTFIPFNRDRKHANHQKLLEDLMTDDPAEAEVIMREHIRTGKESFIESMKPGGF